MYGLIRYGMWGGSFFFCAWGLREALSLAIKRLLGSHHASFLGGKCWGASTSLSRPDRLSRISRWLLLQLVLCSLKQSSTPHMPAAPQLHPALHSGKVLQPWQCELTLQALQGFPAG